MEYIVYNPKRYNGKPCSDIQTFPWAGDKWDGLKSGSMARYPDHVAKELLKRYGFLRRVMPEEIETVSKLISQPEHICEYCDEEFETDKALATHVLSIHKLSEEASKKMEAIPLAATVEVKGSKENIKMDSPELPDTKKGEVDGWYGPGLENDLPDSIEIKRTGDAGVFGG
jgi:hypothetical protein